jgi:hypothetical protein
MHNSKSFFIMLWALVFAIAGAQQVFAQATRTWVSGVGDDANPCSRTAPCLTIAGAIAKTLPGGEIDALDPGGFGSVTITQSVTIDGGGGVAGVLVSGTNGIVVAAGPTDSVIIRGLDIQGIGSGLSGVSFKSGGALHIQNCKISNFVNDGVLFDPTGTSKLLITGTTIDSNGGDAVHLAADGQVTVENSILFNNAGAAIMVDSTNADALIGHNTIVFNGKGLSRALSKGKPVGSIVSFGNNEIGNNKVEGSPTQTLKLE